jgi:hypothetical protein
MARLDLTAIEVAKILDEHTDFVGWQIVIMGALCVPESGRNAYAHNTNQSEDDGDPATPLPKAHRSGDDGLFQLNAYWLPAILAVEGLEVPTLQEYGPMIYDPIQNAKWAHLMWTHAFKTTAGTYTQKLVGAYSAWTAYAKGAHRPYIAESHAAALAAGVDLSVG